MPLVNVIASSFKPADERVDLILQAGPHAALISVDLPARRASTLLELRAPQDWIYIGRHFALAPDRALLHIGASRLEDNTGFPQQVWGLRISDGKQVARIDLGGTIDDLAVGTQARLFLLSGQRSTLTVVDALTQEQTALLETFGEYPATLLLP
jgi:hypothetical protein